jgi:hypothetical protein
MAQDRNILLLGRRLHAEDQLTEMLVWLAEAVPAVGAAVVRLGLGDVELDLAQLSCSTQHSIAQGRLDAIFETESLVLVVESKLHGEYGDDQLTKYRHWVGNHRAERRDRGLMTLTERLEPWPLQDAALASGLGIVAATRRWQDLFDVLSEGSKDPDHDPLASKLIREFLDTLNSALLAVSLGLGVVT